MSTTVQASVPLGEDFPEIRDGVRRICADFPQTYWRELDKREGYPSEFVQAMTEAGFLASLIPEEYGGAGLSIRAAGVILQECHAAGCYAAAAHAQMYTMGTLLRHGSPEQKAKYLPKIASGELRLQAFGVTEPTTGTDTTKLKTRAVRDGDHYVINGQKVWTSRAEYSDLMLLLVRTTPIDQVQKKTDGISVLLVDMREARGNGMTIRKLDAMINHNTTEIFFDNLRVPVENLIGTEGKGFKCILDGMNAERILVSHESIGDGQWFIKTASKYANERIVFDRPIGKNQGIQFPIARAYAELQGADMMVRKAAALFEAGLPCGEDANIAKLLSSESAWNAGEACLQTHGGFGYAKEYDVERRWREARVQRTAPISTNLILAYIGEHVLGLPRSY
ncbi:MAG: acyl-CoA dehydrogenase family protein [Burkholderiaceae bacterium]|jgi:alkylation response protein AidB-like acyl-CoA dehydrogenase|nr:acyl-CoA dehydrogenase family protein [Burkholderiaceae bacterium]